ncbi:DUF2732 family protein [Pectobacterium brasiliense]|uniref:DUF2732 domain-containing protein n=1 Tax=Pectobacterium brasiliense TaxID=180957 RepID=A0A433NIP2_9GAMM|nr:MULTISPECIES: DUF2732 family protein [Pectobacterium]GKW28012.1 hypothetical protein PEC331060_11900 [Pectobacterium carotovorum subsp. carotovorum]MBN3046743.1 DUF2732 domain-containing protein [Pectobacterium brasiliense]MBN3075123.1 DUF2732 domain-containing protein [Pectobacterium brasiliense]MBN3083750.1 DUF2732 domain-containing protein [Pectobacterium brasiliense]MBN3089290.1 DUF2732 domain-containing protein [Pectobacterium brasiliense]
MRNIETRRTNVVAENGGLLELIKDARLEEKKDQHFSFAMRLSALAIHFQQKGYTAVEIIELLRKEAERFEHSAQELAI